MHHVPFGRILGIVLLAAFAACSRRPALEGTNWRGLGTGESSRRAVRVQLGLYDTAAEAQTAAQAAAGALGADEGNDGSAGEAPDIDIVWVPPFYRVWAGTYTDTGRAMDAVESYRERGFPEARWIYEFDIVE